MKKPLRYKLSGLVAGLAALLALTLLAGCDQSDNTPADTTTAQASDTTTAQSSDTTASVQAVPVTVVNDGKTDYRFIRPEEFGAIASVMSLRDEINEKTGAKLDIKSDWDKNNRENKTVESDESVHEILIGSTNRAESRSVAADFGTDYGYVIKYVNGKIVIWGSDDITTAMAVEAFLNTPGVTFDGNTLSVSGDLYADWSLTGEGSVCGTLMKEYTVIRSFSGTQRESDAAADLKKELETLTGMSINMALDAKTDGKGTKEILVGSVKRDESKNILADLTYCDYVIKVLPDKVVIIGGSPLATEQAAKVFVEKLRKNEIPSLDGGYEFKWLLREVRPDSVVWDMSSFVPVWAGDFTVPDWMRDFGEKCYALVSPTGRMTGDAHRGDHQNYPENSAEGILSATLLGADVIEIDPRLTADGVMVLMHDESLKRMTDWQQKNGKNGLPTSDKVSDWTYEQLLCLNLKSGMGGTNSTVTEYKICTAYEAVAIMAGKCMIHWDCKDTDNIGRDTDTFLLASELGAKANFYYYYNDSVMKTWYNLDASDKDFKAFLDKMSSYTSQSGFKRRSRNFDYIAKYGDDAAGWAKHVENGCLTVFNNHIYDFCRYIAQNSEPLKY